MGAHQLLNLKNSADDIDKIVKTNLLTNRISKDFEAVTSNLKSTAPRVLKA